MCTLNTLHSLKQKHHGQFLHVLWVYVLCVNSICTFFSLLRLEKAAALPSKQWAPSSTSQRSTPSVPCRPGETSSALVLPLLPLMLHSSYTLSLTNRSMDGFRLVKLTEVIRQVDIVITCTGWFSRCPYLTRRNTMQREIQLRCCMLGGYKTSSTPWYHSFRVPKRIISPCNQSAAATNKVLNSAASKLSA